MSPGQENKLDRWFQQVGLQRFGGKSVISGQPAVVVHHFYGRRNKATRWYLPNAIPLTHEEHMRLHSEETELMENIIIAKLGTVWFEELRKTANRTAKYFTFSDVWDHLNGETVHYLKDWHV